MTADFLPEPESGNQTEVWLSTAPHPPHSPLFHPGMAGSREGALRCCCGCGVMWVGCGVMGTVFSFCFS